MNLQQLDYFRELAKTQNMTRSAEKLHISQPALSGMLKSLEEELGISLFDRKGRTIVLNINGSEFLKNVNSIFDILGRSRQKSLIDANAERTEIVIGARSTETGLYPIIDKYMRKHNDVSFRIVSHQLISRQNVDDTVDFLISVNPEDHKGRLSCKLWAAESYVVLPKTNSLSAQTKIKLFDLAKEKFIYCAPPDVMPRTFHMCVQAGFIPNVYGFSDERFSVFLLLLQGDFVTIMPKEDAIVFSELSDRLVALPFETDESLEQNKRDVLLSWKNMNNLSPAALDFLKFIYSECNIDGF